MAKKKSKKIVKKTTVSKRKNSINKLIEKKTMSSYFVFFWFIYLELIYKFFIIGDFFSTNTLLIILFSSAWAGVFSLLCNLFKKEKINKIITNIFITLITLITLAQIVYFKFYDSIFSFYSLAAGTGQVMQFWQAILMVMLRIWYIFLLVLVPLVLYFIFSRKIHDYGKNKKNELLFFGIIIILSLNSIIININKKSKDVYSLNNLIFNTHAPILTAEKTGLFTTEVLDLERFIFGFEEKELELAEDESDVEEEIVLSEEKEYNMLEIDFDKLISKTSNKTLKGMHEYFKNVEPAEKNKYTGLFKGKNLIFITAEGFDTIALDEELTPTLYKMANNSYVFTNYYQPLYPVSTSDGEYLNLTSLIPKQGVWSFYKSANNKQPFGLGNIFKAEGYLTYGFHNHNYKYYSRHKSHPNIGLKYIGCYNGLEKKMNCKHWPNSDNEMIKATTDYYLEKDKPFATYYMTVSGHLQYNFYGNSMANRNKKAVKNLKYSDAVKAYIATNIEFDKAMKTLLDRLEEAGKLDDTLIVIAPDHYPYGLTKKQLNERSNIDRTNKFENYHTTLIMYNPSIEKTVVDKTISSIDIIPTVYNLFGLDFDSRLFMGRDIFSDEESIVILSDRSWITDKGRYNSVSKKFKKTTDEELPEDYVNKINKIVSKRVSMSTKILENNYYAKLGL